MTLKQELTVLLNRHSVENESDTPDFILAEYLSGCLTLYNRAIKQRNNLTHESLEIKE